MPDSREFVLRCPACYSGSGFMLEGFRATEQVASLRCSTDTAASSEFRVSWFSRALNPKSLTLKP